MPKELDNEYTLRNGTVKWTFKAERVKTGPQTGDDSPLYLYVGIMLFSGISILAILVSPLFSRKRKDVSK